MFDGPVRVCGCVWVCVCVGGGGVECDIWELISVAHQLHTKVCDRDRCGR